MAGYPNRAPDDPVNPAEAEHLSRHDAVEARALEIAFEEGRNKVTAADRARARMELRAPNEVTHAPEAGAKLAGAEPPPWDEPPERFGGKVETARPDEPNIGKQLAEQGLRAPNKSRHAPKPFPT